MQTYQNLGSRQSGVLEYEVEVDGILIRFAGGTCYKYTYGSAGVEVIETMKQLAAEGIGLNTFINQYKPGFARSY